MPRSPLTLAAAATAAVPGALIVRTRTLGGDGGGSYDSAILELADGSRLTVRAAAGADADRELRAELRVLGALTDGVRSLLPFPLPRVHGSATVDDATVGVVDFLDGYRVAAADLTPGPIATRIGRAIASIHNLPITLAREAGLAVGTPERIRVELSRLTERAAASRRVSATLSARWRAALDDDPLWRFETTVVLGGLEAERFLFVDDASGDPHVGGVLGWNGLAVGDPAVDLAWLSTAPDAAASVLASYAAACSRALDPALAERARLYAELEYASWLLHGIDTDDDEVIADATALLDALEADTRGTDLLGPGEADVAAAAALLDRVPVPAGDPVDTSMQTDTYDPAAFAAYLAAETTKPGEDAPEETQPIDLGGWSADISPSSEPEGEPDAVEDADRASRDALRRWADDGLTRG